MCAAKRLPHALLFTGPSGCGKTTFARILKERLKCMNRNYTEVNAANFRGIDMIRDLIDSLYSSPLGGRSRVAVIDECHQLTKDAQNALLKTLEDAPKHAYLILCTTDPSKLIPTIITRCTEIKVVGLEDKEIYRLVLTVANKEGKTVPKTVIEKITEVSEGSARKALVLLDQVIDLKDEAEQLDCIQKSDTKQQAIDLCRLIFRFAKWNEVAAAIKVIKDEPETVRRIMLGYAASVCLGGGKFAARAAQVINAFRDHFYDCGRPGLVLAAYDVCHEPA
jgi:DNA polymerase III gamma/tau subunit